MIHCRFKMPASDQPAAVQKERDDWVTAIHKLCSDWKRKSMGDALFVESLQSQSIAEDTEDTNTDLESSGGFSSSSIIYPPVDYEIPSSNGDTSQIYPPADSSKPVPAPRSCKRANSQDTSSPTSPTAAPISSPTSPSPTSPSPSSTPTTSSATVSESLKNESAGSPAVKGPPPPPKIPVPPPLPMKPVKKNVSKLRTKAFHWDPVGSEKVQHFKLVFISRVELSMFSQLFVKLTNGDTGVNYSYLNAVFYTERSVSAQFLFIIPLYCIIVGNKSLFCLSLLSRLLPL